MTTSILIYFFLFVIATVLFFGTAVVITVIGVKDLKDLLSGSTTKE